MVVLHHSGHGFGSGGGNRHGQRAPSGQHARQRTVAADKFMNEGHRRMAAGDDDEQPEQPLVRFLGEVFEVRIWRDDVRNFEQAEEVHWPQCRDRIEPPPRQRHSEQQPVEQGMTGARAEHLPTRRRCGFLRAPIVHAPDQAQQGEREHRHAQRLVEAVVGDDVRLFRQVHHIQAEDALHDDQQNDQPVKRLRQAAPVLGIALQRHVIAPSGGQWKRDLARVRRPPAHPCRARPRPRCEC